MSDASTRRPVVRLSGVCAVIGATEVLRGVDFVVSRHEAALVSGPTAAGKSSLIHVLRLALTPVAGRALIFGNETRGLGGGHRAAMKRRIGYVAEQPRFVEGWSAFDNIALPLLLEGRKPRDYAEDVRQLVSYVGLTSSVDEPAWRLSAIERKRAAIARALAGKPDLLVADQPLAGLGREAAQRMMRVLTEIRRVGAAVVITAQDDALADGSPVTRWRMQDGRIARADTVLSQEAAE
jgi:cell division transport system ATP-binding protein